MPLEGEMSFAGVTLRPRERAVLVLGRELSLTPREFEIMLRLAGHPGWVFSADQLADDDEAGYSPESVSVHVARLRHKLESAGAHDVVETVRGFGYRLRADRASDTGLESDECVGPCRTLRDASWQLVEAVLEVEHLGSPVQLGEAAEALEQARRTLYALLAE